MLRAIVICVCDVRRIRACRADTERGMYPGFDASARCCTSFNERWTAVFVVSSLTDAVAAEMLKGTRLDPRMRCGLSLVRVSQ